MNTTEIIIFILMVFLMFGRFVLPEKYFSKKLIVTIFIPILLLFLWFYLLIYQSFIVENVFTVLSDNHFSKEITSIPDGEILAGQKISGEFTATENYLGIMGFRFWTFYRLNEDFLIFRIKEKGSSDWYYVNKYKSDQFQPNQFFTFGFPAIENSKGKLYDFEIESTIGISGDAVGVSQVEPVYIVKYKFPKSLVSSNTEALSNFGYKKLTNLLRNSNFTAPSFVFLLPFLLYVIFVSRITYSQLNDTSEFSKSIFASFVHFINRNKKTVSLSLCFIGLIVDVVFITNAEITYLILTSAFSYVYKAYKVDLVWFLFIGIACLIFSSITYYFSILIPSEKLGSWAWIFIFMWIVSQIWNLRKVNS